MTDEQATETLLNNVQGEVLTTTTINSDERDPQAIRNRLNLLLASTQAEAQRRGSLSQGLQFDGNALNSLVKELIELDGEQRGGASLVL